MAHAPDGLPPDAATLHDAYQRATCGMTPAPDGLPPDAVTLRDAYQRGALTPVEVADLVLSRIAESGDDAVWITRAPPAALRDAARALERRGPDGLTLYGLPFAVKDNIDIAGWTTTAGCPAFAYCARTTAPAVARLLAAGALLVGKTNLDQFATGLVGTRSPYGTPRNPLDPRLAPGGSSSGSAVAVARGLVTFALGTDTAGSGRVPAALCGIVGLKPTRSLISTRGVVPACRSLDCVSVFTRTAADAALVLDVLDAYDPADPFSRPPGQRERPPVAEVRRLGVAAPGALDPLDPVVTQAYRRDVEAFAGLGLDAVPVDVAPLLEAGTLLYGGPWLAERWAAIGPFLDAHPDQVLPVIADVLAPARAYTAVDAFQAAHRLAELRRAVEVIWAEVDALVLPTIPLLPTLAAIAADPIGVNAQLGRLTTGANLLDLAALVLPTRGPATNGQLRPASTLLGPALSDSTLLTLAFREDSHHALAAGTARTR
ncbi:MAG: allophanate hydrolase [Egibacteraceae bacterium]